MVPRTVLTRSGPILVNDVRPVNTVQSRTAMNNAGPMKNVINNAYSTTRRPFNKITVANNSNFTKKVNTVKGTRVNTARPKTVLSAVKGNKGNVVKASACWVWRPKHKVLDHVSRNNGALMSFKRFDYVDAQGRSKITLTNSKPFRNSKDSPDARFKPLGEKKKKDDEDPGNESGNPTEGKDSEVPSIEEPRIKQEKDDNINSTNNINTVSDGNITNNVTAVSSTVNAAGTEVNAVDPKTSIELPNDLTMPELEDIVYSDDDEDVGAEADINNLDAFMPISPIPTTRIHKEHPVDQIIRDMNSTPQTRRMIKNLEEHGLDLVDLPNGKRAIGTKWVCRNKKDERGIVIKNKARLVAQGYTQKEGFTMMKFLLLLPELRMS
ncbi:putative ribonuclease H-like domain-containing protein [Tanacetum coccineum]